MLNHASPVKLLRQAAGLSQDALAAKCGLARITVNRLERGTRGRPSLETLTTVADALGVTVDELLKPPEPKPRASKRRAKAVRR